MIIQVLKNMGIRYVIFRSWYEIKRRSGLLKLKHPTKPCRYYYNSLEKWKKEAKPFFFNSREELNFKKEQNPNLEIAAEKIFAGQILFFNKTWINLGLQYDWITNPETGYKYDIKQHWTEIDDLDTQAGDIKYVWEKSRFSWLYTIIRYDYHFQKDSSEFVLNQITDWIQKNPINCGVNYKCSQEISLRVLNWIFALYYYKKSSNLTSEKFQKIAQYIQWQIEHVYRNINFSRIAVRNNHAITECLTLYIVGTLFPDWQKSKQWKNKGKKWFEKEILYQIYPDGTYLQFSMNYHRVVVQLLTWAFRIAEQNGDSFKPEIKNRAIKSLQFLHHCMDADSGWLPNHGANDGALFFPLNNADYRDYRNQLTALAQVLDVQNDYYFSETDIEDIFWYGLSSKQKTKKNISQTVTKSIKYPFGGYYCVREKQTFTFLRCGKFKDRPAHADGLHLDLWHEGENILVDAGTYKYNTSENLIRYFNGTEGHNTVMLGKYDQMQKGKRFIWYNWIKKANADIYETKEHICIEAEIEAFKHLKKGIKHHREIKKHKNISVWEITDKLNKTVNQQLKQMWHISPKWENRLQIKAVDEKGNSLSPNRGNGWQSDYYGEKYEIPVLVFETKGRTMKTEIKVLF